MVWKIETLQFHFVGKRYNSGAAIWKSYPKLFNAVVQRIAVSISAVTPRIDTLLIVIGDLKKTSIHSPGPLPLLIQAVLLLPSNARFGSKCLITPM